MHPGGDGRRADSGRKRFAAEGRRDAGVARDRSGGAGVRRRTGQAPGRPRHGRRRAARPRRRLPRRHPGPGLEHAPPLCSTRSFLWSIRPSIHTSTPTVEFDRTFSTMKESVASSMTCNDVIPGGVHVDQLDPVGRSADVHAAAQTQTRHR